MAKSSDVDRILRLLYENTSMSNAQIKARLNLKDDRYTTLKDQMLADTLVERSRGRGGGIKITRKGEKQVAASDHDQTSTVSKESDLYNPFIETIEAEIIENEENAVALNTSALRKRGKWSNPDVIKITQRAFPLLRISSINLITYEIKQANKWDASSVYEAASHSAFSHESYVVLEWEKDQDFDDLYEIIPVCQRFSVGLITLQPYYSSFRYIIHVESEKRNPLPDLVEDYLTYIFDRIPAHKGKFESLFSN